MENKKTVIGKVLEAIFSVFKSNWQKFANSLYKKIPKELQDKFSVGVLVVQKLKEFIDSPVADMITAIIPSTVDDEIKNWLRLVLPKILEQYGNVTKDPKTFHNIATDINKELTGLPYGQVALTTEVVYQNIK